MLRLVALPLLLLAACYESSLAEPDAAFDEDGSTDDAAIDAGELDAIVPWDPPVPFDGAVPPEDPGPGVLVYQIDSLGLNTDVDTGFDLDGHDTRSPSDPVGCGIVDGANGVDNRLQNLTGLASSFGFDLGSLILGSSLELFVEIRGYEGEGDEWVRADIRAGTSVIAENAPGSVSDGIVEIHFGELGLPAIPGIGGGLSLPLRLVHLRFDMRGGGDISGVLGGALVWDDGTDEDLESLFQLLLGSLPGGFPIPISLVTSLLSSNFDIALGGPGTPCNSISLASLVSASLVEERED